MNQREFLSRVSQDARIQMNPTLFNRSDQAIMDELQKVILSCQRSNKFFTIKVTGFTVVDNYAQINDILFKYYENAYKNKTKAKKRDNQYAYINLNESDIRLLMVDYHIETPFAVDEMDRVDNFRVIIAVPRIVDRYYFRINGIVRSALYQIVDGSTYNNNNSSAKIPNINFKIVFMAVRVFRYYLDVPLHDGTVYRLTHYMSNIFSKTTSALKYIFAKFGLHGALDFLGISEFIEVCREPNPNYVDFYSIYRADGFWITCPKYILDNEPVVQSAIACIYQSIVPGMKFENIEDPEFWVRSLGANFNNTSEENMLYILEHKGTAIHDTLDKGSSVLDSFENIYDISTKESIRLPEDQKATMYHILRWLVREFNRLRMKDNLDISIKKIRFESYIASLYAMKVAKGIYRVADHGTKITCTAIRKAIRTDPLYLLNTVAKSNLVNYKNMVSDLDALIALKFTYKGIAGLGETDGNSIPEICRHTHPSHLGRLDLDNSSDTNPGITGTISPFTQIYDGYFSDYHEPNQWEDKFDEVVNAWKKLQGTAEALDFKEELGFDVVDERKVVDEAIASMERVMLPFLFEGDGEVMHSPLIFDLGDET